MAAKCERKVNNEGESDSSGLVDPKLAERCFEKGGYWMEPDAWDQKRIHAKGIAIESMFEATRQLLLK